MFGKAFIAVVAAGLAIAQDFSISTPPSLIECQPAAISWTGGKPNYILAAIPAGQVSAPALLTIADGISTNTYTWNVNLAQGTAITLKLTDADGKIAYSSPLNVQKGASQSCLNGTATSLAGAATSGGAAASGSSAASAAVSSGVASASSVSSAIGSMTSAASASASSASASKASGSSTPVSTPSAATSSAAAGQLTAQAGGFVLAAMGGLLAMI